MTTNNNLSLRICYKNVVDVLFKKKKQEQIKICP